MSLPEARLSFPGCIVAILAYLFSLCLTGNVRNLSTLGVTVGGGCLGRGNLVSILKSLTDILGLARDMSVMCSGGRDKRIRS